MFHLPPTNPSSKLKKWIHSCQPNSANEGYFHKKYRQQKNNPSNQERPSSAANQVKNKNIDFNNGNTATTILITNKSSLIMYLISTSSLKDGHNPGNRKKTAIIPRRKEESAAKIPFSDIPQPTPSSTIQHMIKRSSSTIPITYVREEKMLSITSTTRKLQQIIRINSKIINVTSGRIQVIIDNLTKLKRSLDSPISVQWKGKNVGTNKNGTLYLPEQLCRTRDKRDS